MSVYICLYSYLYIIGLSNRLFNRSENKDASPTGSILLVEFGSARTCAHLTDCQQLLTTFFLNEKLAKAHHSTPPGGITRAPLDFSKRTMAWSSPSFCCALYKIDP